MITLSAVSGQEKFKVHASKSSRESSVCQRCMLAQDSFATYMDWMLERTAGEGMNCLSFGQDSYTNLDFADK